MELLTFNTDISSFYPHILRKMHAQFNTIINDNSEAVFINKIRGLEESTFRGYVSNCSLRPRKIALASKLYDVVQ